MLNVAETNRGKQIMRKTPEIISLEPDNTEKTHKVWERLQGAENTHHGSRQLGHLIYNPHGQFAWKHKNSSHKHNGLQIVFF